MLYPEESKELAKLFESYQLDLNNKQKTNLYMMQFESSKRIISYLKHNNKSITITSIHR
nr:MAG: hypothetical protein [Caudoviricetes sp.]